MRAWLGVVVLVVFGAVWGLAADISGNLGLSADIWPDFSVGANGRVSVAGEGWKVTSQSSFDVIPDIGGTERLSLSYRLGDLRVAANASFGLSPVSFTRGKLSGTVDAFDLASSSDSRFDVALSSDVTIGITIGGEIAPYGSLSSRLTVGKHWLSNTTTVDVPTADVSSSLLAYLSGGTVDYDNLSITSYGYVSLSLLPIDLRYVQLNIRIASGALSCLTRATWMDTSKITVRSTLSAALAKGSLQFWGSYSSMASTAFGFGVGINVPWQIPQAED